MAENPSLQIDGFLAIITFDNAKTLNALGSAERANFSLMLRQIDTNPKVLVTLVVGTGRFFSAGANVKEQKPKPLRPGEKDLYSQHLAEFGAYNLNIAHTLAEHTKILVAGMNGPAIGIGATILGLFDFIYAQDSAYLLTPFTSLGVVAETASSMTFFQKMGFKAAREALILGKKLTAQDLLACGFVNEVWPTVDSAQFKSRLIKLVKEQYGDLDPDALLRMKKLLKEVHPNTDQANLLETFYGAKQFELGRIQEAFIAIAKGTRRHKM